jgi:hypothetical protein
MSPPIWADEQVGVAVVTIAKHPRQIANTRLEYAFTRSAYAELSPVRHNTTSFLSKALSNKSS